MNCKPTFFLCMNIHTAFILAFTETWLTGDDNSDSLHIDGFGSPVRLDRDTELTGKQSRAVVSTSLVKKAMERIIKDHITKVTDLIMDLLQFAYRGVDKAKIFILNTIHKHLEIPSSTARLLFADFLSAFNTMLAHIFAEKLITHFHLNHELTL